MQEVLDHEAKPDTPGTPFDAFLIPANAPTISKASPMTDEDEQDLKAYDKAMEDHLKNPVVYSQEEVQKMLDPGASPRQGWATAFKRMHQAGEDKLID